MNTHLRDNLKALSPVGSLLFVVQAATSVETLINGAWLECNGVAVSRTTYAELNTKLSALSYPFGNGDGSTTFNLPDLRGRALWMHGTGSGHSSVNALGDSDGEALANRGPQHEHSEALTTQSHSHGSGGLSVTGAPSGSLSGHNNPNQPGTAGVLGANGTGSAIGGLSVGVGSLDVGGSTDAASPAVSGSIGVTSGPTDEVGYLVGGVWAIKAVD